MEEPGLPLWYLALFWSHVTDGLAFFEQGPSGGPVLLPSWLYPQLLQLLGDEEPTPCRAPMPPLALASGALEEEGG